MTYSSATHQTGNKVISEQVWYNEVQICLIAVQPD